MIRLTLPIAFLLLGAAASSSPTPVHMVGEGVISTPGNEFGGTMSPDGRELYYSISVPRSYMYAIVVSTKKNGSWTRPRLVPFSGHGRDFDPVMAPDGRSMVFISDRPTRPGELKHDYDVWMVDRTPSGGWGTPRHLDPPVNTAIKPGVHEFANNEWFASLGGDGSLYVASDGYSSDGRMGIYRFIRRGDKFVGPEDVGASINGDGAANGEPIVAPDGSIMLFSSYGRKDGYGNWDVYISRRQPNGSWGPAENLGPEVNTKARDYSPRLEPDGHTLIFTSERNFTTDNALKMSWGDLVRGVASVRNGNGNLYEVDLCALRLKSFACPT